MICFDLLSACHALNHRALWVCMLAAIDLEVKTRESNVASAKKGLAFRIRERLSWRRKSVCGIRLSNFLVHTIDALATIDAIALVPMDIDTAS